jgi:hypothetical protein
MAESKSAYFFFEIKACSEKIRKFALLPINRLSTGSECFCTATVDMVEAAAPWSGTA